jgi:DNA-directed RNA polymerase II subunit RPB2
MDDTWKVLDSYFASNKYFLTKHHLSSYNDFVSNKIITTIAALNPIITIKQTPDVIHEINVFIGGIKGQNIYINKPTIVENGEQRLLYPNEARLRDMTYQAEIFADIVVKYITREIDGDGEQITEEKFTTVKIGAIPIMLHSNICVLNNQTGPILREMGECKYDQGGYFIINGKEKVIVAQERIATNRLFINKSKDDKYKYHGLIRCTSEENPLFPKTINLYVYEDRKIKKAKEDDESDEEDQAEEVEDKKQPNIPNAITIESPNISKPIPLFMLFRAFGVESDYDILQHCVYDLDDVNNKQVIDFLHASLIHGRTLYQQKDVLNHLINFAKFKHLDKLRETLVNDFFPNVGSSFKKKALFLGYIINQLVKVCLNAQKESDRDSYIFKRVDISGFLIGNLFRDYYNQFKNKVRNKIDNEYLYGPLKNAKVIKGLINTANIGFIFQHYIIEDGMRKSLKGSWGISEENKDVKQGLVQDLSRASYIGTMSHLRRVNTPIDPTSKIVAPHRLHTSQWGIMCPCESPDGGSIGLLKNLAIMCHITFDTNQQHIIKCLLDHEIIGVENASFDEISTYTRILVNSNWVGIHKDPYTLYKKLKLLKRNSMINIFTSIAWDILKNKMNIQTEAGRCCRPLYVVEKGKLLVDKYMDEIKEGKIGWNTLTRGFSRKMAEENDDLYINGEESELEKTQAVIEFVDVEEANNLYIAMTPESLTKQHTHCEIHPSTILSILSHQIPFANHNQAPRLVFSGAQGKQAIGMYATNFANRIDTMSYVLHYPQKALVNTRFKEYLNNNHMPNGENLIVAIATYTGHNMEDSIIINKAAIDRGSFNLTYYKNLVEMEESNRFEGEETKFGNPIKLATTKEMQQVKFANYTKLDENGYPLLNKFIKEGDAYIGKSLIKMAYIDEGGENNIFENKVKKEFYYDKSSIAGKTLSGTVDKVFVYTGDNQLKVCKIRLRKFRVPTRGDKLCSTIAQKGVIGLVMPAEDMPYTKDGITPDIIINPHAIPSRMTVGQLLECVLGKAGCFMGTTIDATPFNNSDYSEIYRTMEEDYRFDRNGNEIMYNGYYGTQMDCEIFIGPTYYQRLKHMVEDKMNYRKVDYSTIENGSKTHMIKNAAYEFMTRQPTHGRGADGGLRMGNMELDSMSSHGIYQFMQESMMERSDKYSFELDNETGTILNNTTSNDVSIVNTPYTFKLLVQEMMTMCVKPILLTDISEEVEEETYDDFADKYVT